jgi:hypothetical protein
VAYFILTPRHLCNLTEDAHERPQGSHIVTDIRNMVSLIRSRTFGYADKKRRFNCSDELTATFIIEKTVTLFSRSLHTQSSVTVLDSVCHLVSLCYP